MSSGLDQLQVWTRAELVRHAGLDEDEATSAIEACLTRLRELVSRSNVGNPSLLAHFRSEAISAVTAARATERCTEGPGWWRTAGVDALRDLLRGRFVAAMCKQSEALAGPFDADVDFNWPPEKLFGVLRVPAGLIEGDHLILGDGEGNRSDAVVVERNGTLGVEAVIRSFRNPTDDLWQEAWDESEPMIADPA